MSREIIYRCDKCGEVITKPRYTMEITDADSGEVITKDLCEAHKNELLMLWMDQKNYGTGVVMMDCVELDPKVVAEETSKAVAKEFEYAKKKAGRPKKIDEGKVKALADAGWDVLKIADEMHLTESQVRHALSFAEKKEAEA